MAYIKAKDIQSFFTSSYHSLIHFNSRSLRKHYDEFHALISLATHPFPIICVSETWLSEDDKNLYCFPSYNSEYSHRVTSSHGGAAIFLLSCINYRRRTDLFLNVADCESVWIEVTDSDFVIDSKNVIIGSIYRSPCSSIPNFCLELENLLHSLSHENKTVIIVGDVNINLLGHGTPQHTDYSNCFRGYGFESLLNQPTRCPNTDSGTLIDHALTNALIPPEAFIIQADITDHFPIALRFPCPSPQRKTHYTKSTFNKAKFIHLVSNSDWTRITSLQDAQSSYTEFASIINHCILSSTSVMSCKKKQSSPQKRWVTVGLLKSLQKRDNLYRKTKRQPFNSALKQRYKKYCTVLTSIIKKAKRDYYENQIFVSGSNIGKQWRLLNEFMHNNPSRNLITEINHDGITLTHPDEIANAFSVVFSAPPSSSDPPTVDYPRHVPQSFFLLPTSPTEVRSTILNLKNTSAGLDKVHASYIKDVVDVISGPFAYIVNLIFETGVFPKELKKSKTIPVFKKGDRTMISNYRPISILPFFSKVVEKLLEQRLSNYLDQKNIITKRQFGFRHGFSTNLALIALTDKLKKEIDQGKIVGSVFIDFTKAFDTITHDILFRKLASYGIIGPPLKLIQSYLLNREQTISLSDVLSDTKIINIGVPQGSILGPILFLLYINDLPNCLSPEMECLLYADDTTIFTSHTSIEVVTEHLNSDLRNLNGWCKKNNLKINPAKTQFMIFGSRVQYTESITVSVNSHPIICTAQSSFLGVQLDRHLKFNLHISSLVKKTAFGIRVLVKARRYFSLSTLITLYNAFIHSHINYCVTSWGNTYPSHLTSLQHIQNQAARIITFSPRHTHANPLLRSLNLLPISDLVLYNLGITAHNLLRHNHLLYVIGRTNLTNHNNTRFSMRNSFLLPPARTNYRKQSVEFNMIRLWNNLPLSIKSQNPLSSFKRSLKRFLLNSPLFTLSP